MKTDKGYINAVYRRRKKAVLFSELKKKVLIGEILRESKAEK